MSKLKPIGNCRHCHKPIYDNGSVAVHVYFRDLCALEEPFCDEHKLTIAEVDTTTMINNRVYPRLGPHEQID